MNPLTLLLDLDDTLLSNPLDKFMPAYLNLLASKVADLVEPKPFLHQLLASTDKMISKNEINGTLQTCFDQDFYPNFSTHKEILDQRLNSFYSNDYPALKPYTSPRAEAKYMIEKSFSSGSQVVIATNPLFPMTAQLERLKWAGVSNDQFPYSLVTSYEISHFSKPNPEYYAEILAKLGWPDGSVAMIGNSVSEDLQPAVILGISGFLISSNSSETDLWEKSGSLSEAARWLDTIDSRPSIELKENNFIPLLKGTPAAVDSILGNINWLDLDMRENLGQIITDLWNNEKSTLLHVKELLGIEQQEGPFSTQENIKFSNTKESIFSYFEDFLYLRTELLNLSQKYLSKSENHPNQGKNSLDQSPVNLFSSLFDHDKQKMRQILTVVSEGDFPYK